MSKYRVLLTNQAKKQLRKLDKPTEIMLASWIKKNLVDCTDPRQRGRAIAGDFENAWRYRVNDYRIIAEITDDTLIILLVEIGHRRSIYR